MTERSAAERAHERSQLRAQQPAAKPRARRWLITAVAGGLIALAGVGYAVTFAPDHYAQFHAEPSDGAATVFIGDGVALVPEEGWVVQPRVADLVSWAPLRDWRVLTGAETGVEVHSPDLVLSVEFALGGADESAAEWLGSNDVLVETLASGVELQHVDGAHSMRGVATVGAHEVHILAHTSGDVRNYRPALATLLESLQLGS